MMEAATVIRHDIVKMLFDLTDIAKLNQIKAHVQSSLHEKEGNSINFSSLGTEIRPHVSFDELVAEQNYKPVTYGDWKEEVKELQLEESLDELLDALNK